MFLDKNLKKEKLVAERYRGSIFTKSTMIFEHPGVYNYCSISYIPKVMK